MKLSSRAAVLSFSNLLNLFMTMVLGMVLSRLLSTEAYGMYRKVFLIFQTFRPLLLMSLDNSVMYFLPQLDRSQHRGFLLQTMLMLGTLGLIFALVLLLGGQAVADVYGSSELTPLLRAFALYPAFFLPSLMIPVWLISIGRAMTAGVIATASEFLRVAGTIGLAFFVGDLRYVFIWDVGVVFVQVVILLRLLYRTYGPGKWKLNFSLLREQWAYALPLGIAAIASNLLKRFSNNVVAMFFTAEAFAIFTNGAFELPFVAPITKSVMAVLLPEFVRFEEKQRYDKMLSLWLESLRRLALLIYPMTVFFLQFATPAMILLFSETYAESAVVFRVFTLIVPLRIAQYGAIIKSFGKTRWILWTTLFSLGVTFFSGLLLLRWVGITGPAWGTVLGVYVLAGVNLWLISRLLGTSFFKVYPWKRLGLLALLSLLAGIPTQFLILSRTWPAWQLLSVGAVVYGLTYLGLGLLTGIIRRSDLNTVFDLVRRFTSKFWGQSASEDLAGAEQ